LWVVASRVAVVAKVPTTKYHLQNQSPITINKSKYQTMIQVPQQINKYKKPIVITTSLIVLQIVFGFDPKFTLINLIWLLV
jgi:hypothetical protein